MGILDRLQRPTAQAEVTWSPVDDRWFQPVAAFAQTFAGFPIGPDAAMRVSAVFACTSLLSEVLASLPCVLYRRLDNGGREKARDHRWYKAVRHKPNRRHTRIDYFGNQQLHCGLRGNALAEILDDGRTGELLPLHPDSVTVSVTSTGRYRYEIKEPGREPRTLPQEQVLHVRDLSMDGITGMSRALLAREAIAVAAAGEAFVGGFFKNDATGRLLITHPVALNEQKRKEFRDMVQENYAGWTNRSKAMLLTNGVTATELGQHDDSGFIIDPRKFQVADIARFWRVPLFMIGLEEKSSSWGTGVESQKQSFVDFTIKSWADRHVEAMNLSLLDEAEQEEFFFEFLFADLVRGDLLARLNAYAIGITNGIWNPNEIRMRENEPPREGGDRYQDNLPGAAPNAQGRQPTMGSDMEDDDMEARRIPAPLVADAAARIAEAECHQIDRAVKAGTALEARLTAYYTKHRDYALQVVAPLCQAYGLESWVAAEVAARVERTALAATQAGDTDWRTRRQQEIGLVLSETFTAGAALRPAA